jgi:hypothetical protein
MKMRDIMTLVESRSVGDALYRWVDEKGALAYIRRDAMVGRVKHFIPKALIPNANKYGRGKWFTGLSFSGDANRWDLTGDCCFVVSNSIPNDRFNINGQAIYNYGQSITSHTGLLKSYEQNAVEDSRNDPDEIFVVGNLPELSRYLVEIRVKSNLSPKTLAVVTTYAEQHGIQVIVKQWQGM